MSPGFLKSPQEKDKWGMCPRCNQCASKEAPGLCLIWSPEKQFRMVLGSSSPLPQLPCRMGLRGWTATWGVSLNKGVVTNTARKHVSDEMLSSPSVPAPCWAVRGNLNSLCWALPQRVVPRILCYSFFLPASDALGCKVSNCFLTASIFQHSCTKGPRTYQQSPSQSVFSSCVCIAPGCNFGNTGAGEMAVTLLPKIKRGVELHGELSWR